MKKLLSTTLTLLLVIGLGTSTLKAEEKTEPKHDAKTGITVNFDREIHVIDPDNPDTNPEVVDPGNDSAIQIWKVPKKLEFKAKRSNKNQVVVSAEGAAPTYGVFDFHSKSPNWTLLAKLSHLTEASGAREENLDNLEGARLQWKVKQFKRITIDSENKRVEKEAEDIVDRGSFELTAGIPGSINVMCAVVDGVQPGNKGHFEGTMEDLGLVIPAFQGNPESTYTGTITWTLQTGLVTAE